MVAPGRLVELSGAPPLSAKLVPGSPPELILVSSAASLLEGDELAVELVLLDGAELVVRSAAAQLAFPCLHGGATSWSVHAELHERATLVWRPEPLVVCSGANHTSTTLVEAAGSSRLLWSDEVALGRSDEPVEAIALSLTTSVLVDGGPVLRDGFRLPAPGATGPAVIGTNRYLATVFGHGVPAPAGDTPPPMRLASGAWLDRVLAPDARGRDARLARLGVSPLR